MLDRRAMTKIGGVLLVVLLSLACGDATPAPEPGVALQLARQRAGLLAAINYRLKFDIPAEQSAAVEASAVISFELADNRQPLQLDFRPEGGVIRSLRSNGSATDYDFGNEHLVLPPSALRVGPNEIVIEFQAGASSLNRNPDYLYTLFVPDRARTVFPLFDQPDLKARFELTLAVPASWQALANAPLAGVVDLGERREYRFTPSDPISSYLFSFVAGEFQVVSREVNGRPMTMLHRETDPLKLARNLDAIFALHADSIAWLEDYTGIEYPFQKFDFVLLPDFPYGGMEHVGAIQYRASSLLLDEAAPLTDKLGRAQLIAHETAHMWFGNLVTMRWFDDVWTKEVFANFMADKMVNPAFPEVDHALSFLLSHYPKAYAVDRSEGANPIRQSLPNLNEAGQMYGDIIYHKAPIMMRQLELIVGEREFRDGLRQYLQQFAYGNATWPQLITILDAASERDLAAWSEVWVNTPGRPAFSLQLDSSAAVANSAQLRQDDPAGRGRVWPQRFSLLRLSAVQSTSTPLLAEQALTSIPSQPGGEPTIASLYNADGMGYGLFPPSTASLLAWDRLQPVQRGSALVNAYDNLLEGPPADVEEHFALLLGIVAREEDPLLLQQALDQLAYIYNSLLGDGQRERRTRELERVLWQATQAQPDSSRTKLLFRSFAALASSPARVQQLYDIWTGAMVVDGLVLEEDDRVSLAQTLAIRLPAKSAAIIKRQLAMIDNPDRRRSLEFVAPSLAAEVAVRDAFFESLLDQRNRRTEKWVGDALRNLHHPSRLEHSKKYVLPSLEALQEIQVTGDIFFPSNWLQATLGNHHSPQVASLVRQFLARRPDYNDQLRMKILQAADPLFRAAAIRPRAPLARQGS